VSPLPSGWSAHYNEFGVASFIQSSTAGSQVSIGFTGPSAAVKIIVSSDSGEVQYSVDGGAFAPANITVNGWTYLWAFPVAKDLSTGSHTLTIRVTSGTARLINVEAANTGGPQLDNLALTAAADAVDSIYGPDWGAEKARDGLLSTKWTSTDTSSTHWLALDLGGTAEVSQFVVKHASAGGEWDLFDTEAFTIQSGPSMSGPWTVEFTGSKPGSGGISTFTYGTPQSMRYVRLHITDAGIDDYARIPEFEVWGQMTVTPPSPVLGGAVSRKTHATTGDWDIDVGSGDVESRSAQIGTANPNTLTIIATFDIDVAVLGGVAAVQTDAGTVTAVMRTGVGEVTINLTDLPLFGQVNLSFNDGSNGVVNADHPTDPASASDSTLCVRIIVGDYNNLGQTSFLDFSEIKAAGYLNQPVTDLDMARADFDCTGQPDFLDFAKVNGAGLIDQTAPDCTPPIGP
jgi:hypothetical protein